MIESLESRTLFSTVSTDEATLTTDALAVQADFTAVVAASKVEVTAVTADLKALPKTAGNKSLVKATLKDEAAVTKLLTNGLKKIVSIETGKLKQVVADGLAVALHPKSATAEKRLKAVLSTVVSSVQTPLTNLGLAVYPDVDKVAADFSAIEIANPTDTQLTADVSTDGGVVTTDLTKLETDAGTFSTDLTALVTALS